VLLARRVADGLAYAHARGIVHCDIKPANIHLGRKDKPKILDFGIARAIHGSALPALDGMVAGSPHYLSPEQLLGATVDARCDIYSLGVVLYEMLSGRKAFDGASLENIYADVLAGRATPLSEVVAGVPASLSALVARAMARDPAERPATAAELSLELRRWLDADAATAKPVAAVQEASDAAPAVRQRATAGWRLRVGAAGAVLAAAALWLMLQPSPPEPVAPVVSVMPRAVLPMAPALGTEPAEPAEAATPAIGVTNTASSTPAATPALTASPASPLAKARPRAAATAVRAVSTAAQAAALDGSVQLAISPWGHVEVNGSPAGTTPPLTRLTLPEGAHTITVRNEDFAPHTVTVEVIADKPVTVRHRFGS